MSDLQTSRGLSFGLLSWSLITPFEAFLTRHVAPTLGHLGRLALHGPQVFPTLRHSPRWTGLVYLFHRIHSFDTILTLLKEVGTIATSFIRRSVLRH